MCNKPFSYARIIHILVFIVHVFILNFKQLKWVPSVLVLLFCVCHELCWTDQGRVVVSSEFPRPK